MDAKTSSAICNIVLNRLMLPAINIFSGSYVYWVSTVHCCSAPIHPLSEGSVLGLSNTQANSRRHNGRAFLTSSLMSVWCAKSSSACLNPPVQKDRLLFILQP